MLEEEIQKMNYKSSMSNFYEKEQKSNLNYKHKYEDCLGELNREKLNNENSSREICFLEKQIEEKDNILQEKNEIISSFKKTKNSVNSISSSDSIRNYKNEIDVLKLDNQNEKNKNREYQLEIEKYKNNEKKEKSDSEKLKIKVKKYKNELKHELNEKIEFLKELERLKESHMISIEKQNNLREEVETNCNDSQRLILKKKQIEKEKEYFEREYRELKVIYDNLQINYEKLEKENEIIIKEFNESKKSDLMIEFSKLEEENFTLKSEINLWKLAFIEISKHKLVKYDYKQFEELIKIDKQIINNSPNILKENVEYIISNCKRLIDEEDSKSIDMRNLIKELNKEREKLNELFDDYKHEIQLRRKIHSRYMMLRGNMRIMCRIRPFIECENILVNKKIFKEKFKIFNDTISILDIKSKKYELDYIFNQNHNQQDVYDEVSVLVQNMKSNTNICVFAYGQTCTGKTYTIEGPNKHNSGITLRAAKELFEMANEFKQNNFRISLSIIEIHNENIHNLLAEGTPQLAIFENSNSNLIIPELNPIHIYSYDEAVKLCSLAKKLRHTNHNMYNERSSRSHCIYTFYLKFNEANEIKKSKIHIIDLAGSERLSKNNIYEESLRKESISINLSLNSLSNVLNSISRKENHIPYRDSKLTHFLKESLTENFNILLILHLSPRLNDIPETISTLEFGTRLGKICKYKTGKEKSRTHSHAPSKNNKL